MRPSIRFTAINSSSQSALVNSRNTHGRGIRRNQPRGIRRINQEHPMKKTSLKISTRPSTRNAMPCQVMMG